MNKITNIDDEIVKDETIHIENNASNEDFTKNVSIEKINEETLVTEQESNSIIFYGVTYLGCATVNAPKSENEITRIMATLNEQGKEAIEVTLSIPQTIEEKIILSDKSDAKIAEYKMSQILFVVRGSKNSNDSCCFAFTTCHGTNTDNLMFSCHVFRCNLPEAVGKVLYSFWQVFNRQSQQKQHQQNNNQSSSRKSTENVSSAVSTAGQIASFLGSFYGFGQTPTSNNTAFNNSYSSNMPYSSSMNPTFYESAAKLVKGRIEDQYVFRTALEIKEEDPKNPYTFVSVPKDKDFFKLRKNLEKQINI